MTTQQTTAPEDQEQLPPIEVPTDDTRHVLAILQPSLGMAINELMQRNQPGWASFLGTVYNTIDDVMRPQE